MKNEWLNWQMKQIEFAAVGVSDRCVCRNCCGSVGEGGGAVRGGGSRFNTV